MIERFAGAVVAGGEDASTVYVTAVERVLVRVVVAVGGSAGHGVDGEKSSCRGVVDAGTHL
jgi:hypothetical protein